ncbi:hypothetical protein BTW15_29500 [Pseudomonas syringae pv. tomato]|uniref:CobQ/CobB/MinD/ParA nucleotide binding domain-containing protein n=8 Tax=Pseudomonas syringae group TaxID=136849 RepID=A0AAW4E4V8_PSESX|nr:MULTISPECIES: hypothetical protein [Pseudomonas syringae group]MDU8430973.1 hypothetical protein [Pseudomonas syringae pv. actinidifoliorum]KGK92111.1 hypothetical protein NB04_28420 [Pseudomonas syringae pv. tomato]KPW70755.1 hypothetical protein ALO78_200419 [Pseudomonas amygdali pv. ciccaronei]KPZ09779.1 hypothetical protein ALO41_101303 [Pseudomonas amygdali pv. ulmi]KUR39571.1 hypothetical protein PSTA9_04903 [Pseudomonas syringae pv. tomato]
MSNLIFIGGQKGGTTKTTTAHLMSLGAILRGQPAAYVLTDPHRLLKPEGRPYGVMDGRDGAELAKIITASSNTKNGWLIIDGGGNRPELDRAISEQAQLTILPFRGSEEDLETISRDLAAMPNAVALPSAWPTNKHAQEAAQKFIDALEQVYPGRVVKTPIYFVNSALELLGQRLDSPSTPVRNAARRAFSILSERLQLTLAQKKQ